MDPKQDFQWGWMEREGVNEDDADDNDDSSEAMSPAEKRALDAEKRAAWRKARLKSLENVNTNSTTQIQLEPVNLVLSDSRTRFKLRW